MTEKRPETKTLKTRLRWEVEISDRIWNMLIGPSDKDKFKLLEKWLTRTTPRWSNHLKGPLFKVWFLESKDALCFESWLKTMDARNPTPSVVEINLEDENQNEYRKQRLRTKWGIKSGRAEQRTTGERKSRSRKLQPRKSKPRCAKPIPPELAGPITEPTGESND